MVNQAKQNEEILRVISRFGIKPEDVKTNGYWFKFSLNDFAVHLVSQVADNFQRIVVSYHREPKNELEREMIKNIHFIGHQGELKSLFNEVFNCSDNQILYSPGELNFLFIQLAEKEAVIINEEKILQLENLYGTEKNRKDAEYQKRRLDTERLQSKQAKEILAVLNSFGIESQDVMTNHYWFEFYFCGLDMHLVNQGERIILNSISPIQSKAEREIVRAEEFIMHQKYSKDRFNFAKEIHIHRPPIYGDPASVLLLELQNIKILSILKKFTNAVKAKANTFSFSCWDISFSLENRVTSVAGNFIRQNKMSKKISLTIHAKTVKENKPFIIAGDPIVNIHRLLNLINEEK